ncbi:hypothetical protein DFH06DRAFT_1323785 [Mycena polygramma]|nr:hypothetical protein DFH06DRAFT_1323785 [Mycena polygramma]
MTNAPQERDPKIWVKSRGGTWYWRHPSGSFWKGPRSDRAWVPAIDVPDWLPPPPDDFSNLDAEVGSIAPAQPAPQQFGSVPANPPGNQQTAGVQNTPARRPSAFGSASTVDRWGSTPLPRITQSTYTSGSVTYTGPYANTMRHRDESARLDRERREREDRERMDRERDGAQRDRDRREQERSMRERSQRDRELRDREEERDREVRNREHRQFEKAQNGPQDGYHHGSASVRPDDGPPRREDLGRNTPRRDVRSGYSDALQSGAHREEHRAQSQAHHERAKEQQLRDRVRESRGSKAPSSVSSATPSLREIPDVDKAKLDRTGHPIFPTAAVDEEESEYGGTTDSDEEEAELKKFRARESTRVGEARRKVGAETPHAVPAPSPPESVGAGIWATVGINSVREMRNLLRWMSAGCPRARAAFTYLRDYYSHHPTAARSDGVQYLMRRQTAANTAWLYATTGDSTPMSRRPLPGGAKKGPTRTDRRRMKREREEREGKVGKERPKPQVNLLPRILPDRDVPDRVPNAPVEDVPMPPAEDTPAPGHEIPAAGPAPTRFVYREQSYLGFSLPPPNELAVTNPLGPAGNLGDVMTQWSSVPPHTWMQGVRMENGLWPTQDSPVGSRPNRNDVLAARFITFISPSRDPTSLHHSNFVRVVLTGFSVRGLFEHFVRTGGYRRASDNLEEFPFDGTNMTTALGFAWVVTHGVWEGSPAAELLQSFATSWRNHREGGTDPLRQQFAESPINADEIPHWPDSQITRWQYIRYGPVRPGVTTASAQVPSGYWPAPVVVRPAPVIPDADTDMKDLADVEADTVGVVAAPVEGPGTQPRDSPEPPLPRSEGGEPKASVTLGTEPVVPAPDENTKPADA